MTQLAVTGYASLDYPVALSGRAEGNATTHIKWRSAEDWPRLGGCPAYVTAAAVSHGVTASPVCWTGANREGDLFVSALEKKGVSTAGVDRIEGERAPSAMLIYQSDGSCICLYDPAFGGAERLTDDQAEVVAEAENLCVTVGPGHLMDAILAARNPQGRLSWVLKNDLNCFTPEICRRLSADAEIIFCNRHERGLIAETRDDVLIVETQGAEGVVVERCGERTEIAVEPVSALDTTGAGDTFAGGFLGAWNSGVDDPVEAARCGIADVRTLLVERSGGKLA
ncbi:carbohydrate kinase family protein [Hoeflea sp. CAU 1731]